MVISGFTTNDLLINWFSYIHFVGRSTEHG